MMLQWKVNDDGIEMSANDSILSTIDTICKQRIKHEMKLTEKLDACNS